MAASNRAAPAAGCLGYAHEQVVAQSEKPNAQAKREDRVQSPADRCSIVDGLPQQEVKKQRLQHDRPVRAETEGEVLAEGQRQCGGDEEGQRRTQEGTPGQRRAWWLFFRPP